MSSIILSTDDTNLAAVVPRFFEGYAMQVVSIDQLIQVLHLTVACSYCIIGLPELSEQDWTVLDLVKGCQVPAYLMVRREVTNEEVLRAKQLGITRILIDPIVKLRGNGASGVENLFRTLAYRQRVEPSTEDTIFIGCNTYFNMSQHWITYLGQRTQLSDREADILKLFIRYEGKIVTKEIIAQELWDGRVVSGGIPKLVSRLREKLGVSGKLINGRKQGGYIYEKDEPPKGPNNHDKPNQHSNRMKIPLGTQSE